MKRRKIVRISIFAIIVLGIFGTIIRYYVVKDNLRKSIVNERKFSAETIEADLPATIINTFDYIDDASITVDLSSYVSNYKMSNGEKDSYMNWEDNITLVCVADESFNSKTNSFKLECFKKITETVKKEAGSIQSRVAPVYDEYYSRYGITNVFEQIVFCSRNVKIQLTAGEDVYSYNGYSWHISEAFTRNGEEIDLTLNNYGSRDNSNSKTNSNTKKNTTVNSGKKSNKKSNYSYDEYPDCDDYDSWEDFMDDWDGNMPDDLDASDYWDDW